MADRKSPEEILVPQNVGKKAFRNEVAVATYPSGVASSKSKRCVQHMPEPSTHSFSPENIAALAGRDAPIDSPEELAEIDTLFSAINRRLKVVARRNSTNANTISFEDLAMLMKKWGTLVQNIIATRDVLIKHYNREIIESAQEAVLEALETPEQRAEIDTLDLAKIAQCFSAVIDKAEKQTTFRFHREETLGENGNDPAKAIFEILTNDPTFAKDLIAAKDKAVTTVQPAEVIDNG